MMMMMLMRRRMRMRMRMMIMIVMVNGINRIIGSFLFDPDLQTSAKFHVGKIG